MCPPQVTINGQIVSMQVEARWDTVCLHHLLEVVLSIFRESPRIATTGSQHDCREFFSYSCYSCRESVRRRIMDSRRPPDLRGDQRSHRQVFTACGRCCASGRSHHGCFRIASRRRRPCAVRSHRRLSSRLTPRCGGASTSSLAPSSPPCRTAATHLSPPPAAVKGLGF